MRVISLIAFVLGLCLLAGTASAQAQTQCPKPRTSTKTDIPDVQYPGMQRIRYCFGPINISPGQNTINFRVDNERPTVPGYITRFKPNLMRMDGSIPRVDILHLHHAVWLINGNPTFAAGEEKTIIQAPKGFGWAYKPTDSWLLNDMIHNLTPNPDKVYVVYDIDFVPSTSPAAAKMKTVRTKWMDVAGIRAYPVFNSKRAYGTKGKFTFPDQAPAVERAKEGPAQSWTVRRPSTLVATAGHLHPGGLWTDLRVTRNGVTKMLFRSKAKYWEPMGKVSWNVAMTATPKSWRIKLQPGDVVSTRATYDVSKISTYEDMGITPIEVYDGVNAGGVDPFKSKYPTRGKVTHGQLPENSNSGGEPTATRDPRKLKAKPATGPIDIKDFYYSAGDLNKTRKPKLPEVQQGQSLTFVNEDASGPQRIMHTITACAAPCNGQTGVAFPLANGPVDFDSTTLGFGPPGLTAASNTDTWSTPSNLPAGTYTYFCRIHPFMRGAFRVEG